jgi:hypothetical protein
MADTGGNNNFEVILIAVLIIILLIIITMVVYYLRRRSECFYYPSPWCYGDWICENTTPQNRWEALRQLGLSSAPSGAILASDGICFLPDGSTAPQSACSNQWETFLNAGNTCVGPNGNTGPCNVPYNSQPVQPLPSNN